MTKFYLHAASSGISGTLPSAEQSSLAADADFEGSETTNRSMSTTIGSSATSLANSSNATTSPQNYYVTRFVSPLLYQAKVDSNTWNYSFAAQQSNSNANFPVSGSNQPVRINIYIWQPSTGTKIGTILDGDSTSDVNEPSGGSATSAVGHVTTFAGAEVTGITPGDAVVIVEIWFQVTQAMSNSYTQTFFYDGATEPTNDSTTGATDAASFIETPEDLQLTQTGDNDSMFGEGGSIASTANTTQFWPVIGRPDVTTTEAEANIVIRKAGTISKMSVNVISNSIAGDTPFTLRVNGADTSLVATATASTTGVFEDLSNSVSVSAGDLICVKSVPGAATGTFALGTINFRFAAGDSSKCQILGGSQHVNLSTASSTFYIPVGGGSVNNTSVEAIAKIRQRGAGTYQYLYVYVSSNSRTTTTTIQTRVNGVDGNISISVGSGATGVFEDTSNTDTVAIDDDYNFSVTTGSGTGTITYTIVAIHFFPSSINGYMTMANTSGATISANLTRYLIIGGTSNLPTTDADARRRVRLTKVIFKEMHIYVSDNTVSADSTLTFRINGANGNQSITIPANTTGLFSDTTNTDTVYSADDVNFQIVTGATGTSLIIREVSVFYEVPSSPVVAIARRVYAFGRRFRTFFTGKPTFGGDI